MRERNTNGMSRRQRLVVVGNGMAGMRTVEELLARAPDRYDITVIGAEPHPNYNRILLSSVLAGDKSIDEIVINPLDWYRERAHTPDRGRCGNRDRPDRENGDARERRERSATTSCCSRPDRSRLRRRSRASVSRASTPSATSPMSRR